MEFNEYDFNTRLHNETLSSVTNGDESTTLVRQAYACYEVGSKPTNIPEGIEDAYFELGGTSSWLINTYYGLCGNVEADKLQAIYNKVQDTHIDNESSYIHEELKQATKDELMALITRWKYIATMIPINWRYLSELSDLIGKIVAFEENRMPCVKEDGTGLDTVVENNMILVEESKIVSEGMIVYTYYTGDYKWDTSDTAVHASMVKKLQDIRRVMYTDMQDTSVENDKPNVASRLYRMTDLFLKTWEDYYKIGDNGQTISLTTELLDAGEFEIYEEEGVYETFIQTETDLLVAPAEGDVEARKANVFMNQVLSVAEINKLINEAAGIKDNYKTFEVDNVRLYKNPIYKTDGEDPEVVNANAILEYGQFLATIQSRRNLIQQGGQGGDEVLVKFTQTERGTFFEILGKEPESSSADVYEGAIAGFYISKGYQGKVAASQHAVKPTIPRGRYDRKIRKSVIPAKPVSAAPDPAAEEWRITIVPKFYEGEPLDWTKDNYYTTFLFAQNADNLNIQIDPEFEARNKVVFTPGTGDNQPERLEQQMIGYFVAVEKKPTGGN